MPLPQSKNKVGLGRAIVNRKAKDALSKNSSQFHTTDVNNYGSTSNLRSVTHEGDLEEFLNTAQLADADFTAERRNVTVISAPNQRDARHHNPYLLTIQEERDALAKHALNKERLRVPRRPEWTSATTRAQLERKEKDAFLEWRRGLAELQDGGGLVLTPFERNIEVWRQLWRVIERSHLIVQIVDARNPLRFRCEDLEKYVQGLDIADSEGQEYVNEANGEKGKRRNLLLINKADLLDDQQRREWAKHFDAQGIQYAFFSALNAAALQAARAEEEQRLADEAALAAEEAERRKQQGEEIEEDADDEDIEDGDNQDEQLATATQAVELGTRDAKPLVGQDAVNTLNDKAGQPVKDALVSEQNHVQTDAVDGALSTAATDLAPNDDPCRVLNVLELEELFMACAPSLEDFAVDGQPVPSKLTVGLVGYPNVGKSSTINALLGEKKVSVSATPGKTKHFQTIHLSPETVLCDCPGLVFPQFATTTAELVTDGVLPIDQMREFTAPAELVSKRIPKDIIEATYGIRIDTLPEEEGGTGVPTGLEMLTSYALARGYTRQGQSGADESRAVRYILKDYVNAKLLYSHPPPGLDGDEFNAAQRKAVRASLAVLRRDTNKAHNAVAGAAAAAVTQEEDDDNVSLDELDESDLDALIVAQQTGARATPGGRPSAKSLALDSAFFDAFGSARPNIQGRKGMGGVAAIRGKIANDGTMVGPEATTTQLAVEAKGGKKHHKANKRKKQRSGAGFD